LKIFFRKGEGLTPVAIIVQGELDTRKDRCGESYDSQTLREDLRETHCNERKRRCPRD
jgi:hypothetical protein